MPIQQICEQPSRLLIRVASSRLQTDTFEEFRPERDDALLALGDFLGRSTLFGLWTRYLLAFRLKIAADRFKPVAQTKSRNAVILVVALNCVSDLRSDQVRKIELESLLHGAETSVRVEQGHAA